jgi:hypothetical protein
MNVVRPVVLLIVLVGLLAGYYAHQVLLIVGGDVRSFGDSVISLLGWLGWVILILGIAFTFWRDKLGEDALGR